MTAPQPNGAHRIFPSNDHPIDLATYTIQANTPAASTFVANGERVSRRRAAGAPRGSTGWSSRWRRS